MGGPQAWCCAMDLPPCDVFLRGAAVFDGRRLRRGLGVLVRGGKVARLLPDDAAVPADVTPRDLAGGILLPGFVDLQANGGGGALLGTGDPATAMAAICATHARFGATTVFPTLITSPSEVQAGVIAAAVAAARSALPGFGGLHLEGPHLDPARAGAHDPGLIRPMGESDLQALVHAARALPRLLVTLSPGAASAAQITALARAGAVVSLGHSACSAAQAREGFAAGARGVTHLFNAMGGLHHRDPGLAAAALGARGVFAGLIADDHHVAPEMIAVAFSARRGLAPRTEQGLFLVSDAMSVAGTDLPGFLLNGRSVQRRGGRLTLADGTLAGADYTLAEGVALLVGKVGLPLETALQAVTSTPARFMGLSHAGRIAPGGPADLVHLDGGMRPVAVWQAGRPVPPSG
jgi:N-acetylglucosamine-6-phosphate deacetylase